MTANKQRLKPSHLLLVFAFSIFAMVSCSKNHFDFDHFEGVEGDGELKVPVATMSKTLGDLITELDHDGMVSFDSEGNMRFLFHEDKFGVVKASDFMKFDDQTFSAAFTFANPYPFPLPIPIDTMVSLHQECQLASNEIGILGATFKSGALQVAVTSNLGDIDSIVLHSSQLKNADGSPLSLSSQSSQSLYTFNLTGCSYVSAEENELDLTYDVYFTMHNQMGSEFSVNFDARVHNLAFSHMRGYVYRRQSNDVIDTTFSLFSNNLTGAARFLDASVKFSERNDFGIPALLRVDTAMITGDDMEPYTIFENMPKYINVPQSSDFVQTFEEEIDGLLNMNMQRAYSSAVFTLNPDNLHDIIDVDDTDVIDTRIDVEVPFKFNVPSVNYVDTVSMRLSDLDSLDMLDDLLLDIIISNDIPFNMNMQAYFYDSQHNVVLDSLFTETYFLPGSFDGTTHSSMAEVHVDQDRIDNVMDSDMLIVCYHIDTDGNDVEVSANQHVDFVMRASVKYNGIIYGINNEGGN